MNEDRIETHAYPYRLQGPSISLIGLLIAIFGALMLFMAWQEPHHFIGLPVGDMVGALLYGALAAVAFGAIYMMVRAWWMQRGDDTQILLEAHRILLPKTPFSNRIISIPFTQIQSVQQQSASRAAMRFIVIKHDGGHTQIANFGFETSEIFETLFEDLRERVR